MNKFFKTFLLGQLVLIVINIAIFVPLILSGMPSIDIGTAMAIINGFIEVIIIAINYL